MRKLFIILSFVFLCQIVRAQNCQIIAPSYTCINSLVSLKVNTNGIIPQHYNWQLGDGRTSQQANPGFSYKTSGTYTLTVEVTFAGGSKCTATSTIIAYDPPTAKFLVDSVQDFCNNPLKTCIIDISTPGPAGNPIVKRAFLWGDGLADNATPTIPANICHNYIAEGQYLLAIEVTDNKGCVSKAIKDIEVEDTIAPNFSVTVKKVPFQCQVITCFKNETKTSKKDVKYVWLFGDGQMDSTSKNPCYEYASNGTYYPQLLVISSKGCATKVTKKVVIDKPTLTANLKQKRTICLNDSFSVENNATNPTGAIYEWTISDSATGDIAYFKKGKIAKADYSFVSGGKYYISLKITYDSCETTAIDSVDVLCPSVNFLARNNELCDVGDTTFFCPSICRYKADNIVSIWDFGHGDQCTTDTKNGRNVGKNCRFSLDESPWHVYDFNSPTDTFVRYRPTLYAKDTVTGCESRASSPVILGKLDLSLITVDISAEEYCTIGKAVNKAKRTMHLKLSSPQGLDGCTVFVNVDSAADPLNFLRYDPKGITYEYTSPDNDSAWKTIGLAFRNGDDSIYSGCNKRVKKGSFCYDTAWRHQLLNIMAAPRPDLSTDSVFKTCSPTTLSLKLKDTIQKNIKSIQWIWGDGTEETDYFNLGDSVLPAIKQHQYTVNGLYKPQIIMTNTRGCEEEQPVRLAVGYMRTVNQDSLVCAGTSVSFNEKIQYFDTIYDFWHDASRYQTGKEQIWWDYDDGKGFVLKTQGSKANFAQEGIYNLRMATKDSTGCVDTLAFTVKALQPIANFRQMKDTIYCNDNIVQFYDSSIGSTIKPQEKIVSWSWDFGDYNGLKPQQNPLYIFKTFGDRKIKLKVKNSIGCVDSAISSIYFKGPQPFFEIASDSIGCAPLEVSFKNTSKDVSTWVWNMGDGDNTIISTTQDSNVTFIYKNAGVYRITLMGGDSVYNPYTKNWYFCLAEYPVPPKVKEVIASPSYAVSFNMPDTVCVDNLVVFQNLSPAALKNFTWDFGDGKTQNQNAGTAVHTYKTTGLYTVFLKAKVSLPIDSSCVTHATKTIFVESIKADFEISDKSPLPVYDFINQSSENAVRYRWDFGDPASGSNNHSDLKNPSHEFSALDTFRVCLTSFNSQGCPDKVCKTIINDYKPYLFIPNVFTPQGTDTVNGRFDIVAFACRYYHLDIFNRWGEKVFEGFEDGEGNTDFRNWNGIHYNTGEPCPSGVYFVVFNYEIGGWEGRRKYNGTLTLIRKE